MKDERLVVAFDVDDTLIVPSVATEFDRDVPNYETIAVYKWFQNQGNYMIIWSGGGTDYATMWAEKLGLTADETIVKDLKRTDVDIAFDDMDVKLGTVNVKVKRLNNKISRKEWNIHCPCHCHRNCPGSETGSERTLTVVGQGYKVSCLCFPKKCEHCLSQ